ncbi:MAG: Gfo/Idh/MocA family oxidoreductase [Clostridia bacterium]|nr:Gfo/Idh/MocA family oxidoreductase [Clostridia bacterium]
MIKLATIGTSWITRAFIGGISLLPDKYILTAVYSREKSRAEELLKETGKSAEIYLNLEEMAKSDNIDAVYIASPNSLHFEQAMLMVKNGKHVIVEKPMVTSEDEFMRLSNAARENNVIFMEAIIPMHLPARKIIKEEMGRLGRIQSSRFQFCQLSSKYQDYLLGKNPNIFNPQFATGTLMDLGIYCVYPAIDLFGLPELISTKATFLESGSDGSIAANFKYGDHIVSIIASKTCQSNVPSEILGDCGSLSIGHISKYDNIYIESSAKNEKIVGEMSKEELMSYEALDFYRYITDREGTAQEYSEMNTLALTVCAVMEAMRMQADIKFYNFNYN